MKRILAYFVLLIFFFCAVASMFFPRVWPPRQCETETQSLNLSSSSASVPYDLDSSKLTRIDAFNIQRLVQLERVGQGAVRDAFLDSEGNIYLLTTIGLWKRSAGQPDTLLWTYETDPWTFVLSPDQRFLAMWVDFSGPLKILDTMTGREIRAFPTEEAANGIVRDIAFNHQGTHVAASIAGSLYIWSLADGMRTTLFEGSAEGLVFSPDDRFLAASATTKRSANRIDPVDHIFIWNLMSGALVLDQVIEPTHIGDLAFSPDGTVLASSGEAFSDEMVRLWDIQTGDQIKAWPSVYNLASNSFLFSTDGRHLIHKARVYDVKMGSLIATLKGDLSRLSPDASQIITITLYEKVMIWESHNFTLLKEFIQVSSVAFNDLEFDSQNRLFDSWSNRPEIFMSPSKNTLAIFEDNSSSDDQTHIRLCDAEGNTQNAVFDGELPLTFSHHSGLLAVKHGCRVDLRSSRTGEKRGSLFACSDDVTVSALAFNAADTILAVGLLENDTQDVSIQLWDMTTLQPLSTIKGHARGVLSLAFSADNRLLASASADGTVILWGIPE